MAPGVVEKLKLLICAAILFQSYKLAASDDLSGQTSLNVPAATYDCHHHALLNDSSRSDLKRGTRRLSTSQTYGTTMSAIRIAVVDKTPGVFDSTKRTYLTASVLPPAIARLTNTLQVLPVTGTLQLNTQNCNGIDLSSIRETADTVIVLHSNPTQSSLVVASACEQDQNGRPIAVYVSFREASIPDTNSQRRDQLPGIIDATLHQLVHGLVFSVTLFPSFINNPTVLFDCSTNMGDPRCKTLNGRAKVSGFVLVTPEAVKQAQAHLGCYDLQGVELESMGADDTVRTTHWSKRLFREEVMVATKTTHEHSQLSPITLGLFKDSGWYNVDFSKAERMRWGSKKGCNFATSQCFSSTSAQNKPETNIDTESFVAAFPPNGVCITTVAGGGTVYQDNKCSISTCGNGQTSNGLGAFDGYCTPINSTQRVVHLETGCTSDFKSVAVPNSDAVSPAAAYQYYTDVTWAGNDPLVDYCTYYSASDSGICTVSRTDPVQLSQYGGNYGAGARCFVTQGFIKAPRVAHQFHKYGVCFDSRCNNGALQVYVATSINAGTWFQCPVKGGLLSVSGFSGGIRCPPANMFCAPRAPTVTHVVAAKTRTKLKMTVDDPPFNERTTTSIKAEIIRTKSDGTAFAGAAVVSRTLSSQYQEVDFDSLAGGAYYQITFWGVNDQGDGEKTSVRVRTACTVCTPGQQFEVKPCSVEADRTCAPCSTACRSWQIEQQACDGVKNRVCIQNPLISSSPTATATSTATGTATSTTTATSTSSTTATPSRTASSTPTPTTTTTATPTSTSTPTATPSTTPSPSTAPPPAPAASTNGGAIAGGVIGGLVGVAVVGAVVAQLAFKVPVVTKLQSAFEVLKESVDVVKQKTQAKYRSSRSKNAVSPTSESTAPESTEAGSDYTAPPADVPLGHDELPTGENLLQSEWNVV